MAELTSSTESIRIESNQMAPWYRDRFLLAVLIVAAALALAYNYAIIIGLAPDEGRHMNYVKLLLQHHELPRQNADGSETGGAHSFHPPLYYLILLPAYAILQGLPNDLCWHLVRLASGALCLAAIPMIYQIGIRAGGGDINVGRFVAMQVAFLPIWGMTASTINNDSAAFLAVTVFLWLLVVRYPNSRALESAIPMGIALGLGTLCKATALMCDSVALALYFFAQDGWRALRARSMWLRGAGVFALTAAIAGWWHLRSMRLYGTFTPLPPNMAPPLPSPRDDGLLAVLFHPNFPILFAVANFGCFYKPWMQVMHLMVNVNGQVAYVPLVVQNGLFGTVWSQIDWIPDALRFPLFCALALFCLAACIGNFRPSVKPVAGSEAEVAQRVALWSTYAAFAVNYVTVLQVALFFHWGWAEGGRYLLPSFCGFSVFLARGWRGLVGSRGLAIVTKVWFVAFLALNLICLGWLLWHLNVIYGPKG